VRGAPCERGVTTPTTLTRCPAMQIVLEVSDELKPVADELLLFLRSLDARLDRLRAEPNADYAAVEKQLADATAAIERRAHQVLLSALDLDAPAVIIDGVVHARVGRHWATYYTSAGEVVVERSIYREPRNRSARAVDPVSLRAGVVGEGWLPWTGRAMAFLLQQGTAREAHATGEALGRLPFARASFERVAHAVGDLYERHAADTEQALIEAYTVPAEASGIAVSLDRVCVPVEEPRPRPAGRPRQGAPKKPVKRVFRQAYCATITLHDGAGKALHTIRYGRMPEQDVTGLCESLCDDVLTLLKARPALTVTALCDGAHELWALIAEHLAAVAERTPIVELVDLWHLLEKLGSAAREHLQAPDAETQVERWRLVLLNRPRAAEKIRLQLASWVTEGAPSGAGTALHDAQTFLTNHAHRFRYAEARREGRPVGSGVVEATCKSLIAVRLKRPGARWKQPSANRIVQLRALALSDRWNDAMDLTLQHLRRPVSAA